MNRSIFAFKMKIYQMKLTFSILFSLLFFINCNSSSEGVLPVDYETAVSEYKILPGAERLQLYIPLLEGKNIGLVVNHTSKVNNSHLLDTLLDFGIKVKTIFAPEHGFRGTAGAGQSIESGSDKKTGLPIISLYGDHKKPISTDLEGLDLVVFDIQDVGVRFYTYISTMTYVMEACAENNIPFLVLDRPNPNGYYIDGPVLDPEFSSFVGLHSVPVVYGMTIGEYALMVNGEKWMNNGIQCDLEVIPCSEYTHDWTGELPVKPSPNLPNHISVLLYPSLCFFEGTKVSVGRGTELPFQHVGHPDYSKKDYSFTPSATETTKYPKLQDKVCYGLNLSQLDDYYIKAENRINLSYLLDFYHDLNMGEDFFLDNHFIDLLAGTDSLRIQIQEGLSEEEIRETWQEDINRFKEIRSLYLLYN